MLDIVDLSVRLGRTPILHGLTLQAHAGQVLVICGANGAGKSTLLKAVLGEAAYHGTIRLNGQDLATARPDQLAARREIGRAHV